MTALTKPARPAEDDARLRPVPWRRMAGVTWRQHRVALGAVAVLTTEATAMAALPSSGNALKTANRPCTYASPRYLTGLSILCGICPRDWPNPQICLCSGQLPS